MRQPDSTNEKAELHSLARVSRTDDRGATVSDEAVNGVNGGGGAGDRSPESGVRCLAAFGENAAATGGIDLPDETQRSRLIADITRLIREPAMPEPTRLAGLTLIGWLARRRLEEAPHAIGIEEARESEQRIRAAAVSGQREHGPSPRHPGNRSR